MRGVMGNRSVLHRLATGFSMGLCALLGASGCAMLTDRPLVTGPSAITLDTFEEQLAWAEEQADAAIDAAGAPTGWYWVGGDFPEFSWVGETADRRPVLSSLFPRSCGGIGAHRLYLGLKNEGDYPNHSDIADRVRSFWEAQGWAVTDVTPPTDHEQDFRADREDGALLGFTAAENGLVISVYTSCSGHDTMVNWLRYRGQSNPFQDELDRREQQGETG